MSDEVKARRKAGWIMVGAITLLFAGMEALSAWLAIRDEMGYALADLEFPALLWLALCLPMVVMALWPRRLTEDVAMLLSVALLFLAITTVVTFTWNIEFRYEFRFLLIGLAFQLPLLVWRFRRAKLWVVAGFVVLSTALWARPWLFPPPFERAFREVQPGMTVAEAWERLGPWTEGKEILSPYAHITQGTDASGRAADAPERLYNGDLWFHGHVVYQGTPDAGTDDLGVVRIRNGRVAGKSFFHGD